MKELPNTYIRNCLKWHLKVPNNFAKKCPNRYPKLPNFFPKTPYTATER